MSLVQGSIKIFCLVCKCCGNYPSLINFEISICTEVTYLVLTHCSLRGTVSHYSVLYVICVVLLRVPAEKGPVGLAQSDCCTLGAVHGAPRGKKELASSWKLTQKGQLWNKELRKYKPAEQQRLGKGKSCISPSRWKAANSVFLDSQRWLWRLQQHMKKLHSCCIEQIWRKNTRLQEDQYLPSFLLITKKKGKKIFELTETSGILSYDKNM